MRNLIVGVLFMFGAVSAFADSGAASQQLLQQAQQSLQQTKITGWTYERTTNYKGTTYVERFNPQAPAGQHWQLVSINGQPASAAQLKTYADGKNPVTGHTLAKAHDGTLLGISHTTPGNLQKNQLVGCTPSKGLTVIAETDKTVTYRFKPDCSVLIARVRQDIMNDKHSTDDVADREAKAKKSTEMIQDLFSHTEGTLVLDKAGPYIESIVLKNTGSFTEEHVVKIKTMIFDQKFAPVTAGGKTVLMDDDNTVQGTAFFFKTINQHSNVSFSDFKRIVPGT